MGQLGVFLSHASSNDRSVAHLQLLRALDWELRNVALILNHQLLLGHALNVIHVIHPFKLLLRNARTYYIVFRTRTILRTKSHLIL